MVKNGGNTHMYYVYGIFFMSLLCVVLGQFGDSDLVHDLQELYFYDVLALVFGLISYVYRIDIVWYMILANAIWLAKITRLFWGEMSGNRYFVGWPTFGILGLIRLYRKKTRDITGTTGQDIRAWVCLVAMMPLGYVIVVLVKWKWVDQIEVVPFVMMFFLGANLAKMLSEILTDQKKLRTELQDLTGKLTKLTEQQKEDFSLIVKIKNGLSPDEISFVRVCLTFGVVERDMLMRIASRLRVENEEAANDDGNLMLKNGNRPSLTLIKNGSGKI